MYTEMDWWTKIRLEVLRGETSKRELLRREGIHWETLKKILAYSEPPVIEAKIPAPSLRLAPFLSKSIRSSKRTNIFPKSNVTRPNVYTSASGRWAMRANIPR